MHRHPTLGAEYSLQQRRHVEIGVTGVTVTAYLTPIFYSPQCHVCRMIWNGGLVKCHRNSKRADGLLCIESLTLFLRWPSHYFTFPTFTPRTYATFMASAAQSWR